MLPIAATTLKPVIRRNTVVPLAKFELSQVLILNAPGGCDRSINTEIRYACERAAVFTGCQWARDSKTSLREDAPAETHLAVSQKAYRVGSCG